MSLPPFFNAYDLEMVKLGLVTGSLTPRPLASPRVKVVLPVPTSPMSSRTFGLLLVNRFFANSSPKDSISDSELIFMGIIIS